MNIAKPFDLKANSKILWLFPFVYGKGLLLPHADNWFTDVMSVILLLLTFLTWLVLGSGSGYLRLKFYELFESTVRKSYMPDMVAHEPLYKAILTFNYAISAGLFATFAAEKMGASIGIVLFLICLVAILVLHGIKVSCIWGLHYLFGSKATQPRVELWTQNYIFLNEITGIFYLVFTIFMAYGNSLFIQIALVGGGIITVIYLILNVIRIFSIFFFNIGSLFYLILYFCTLEILPLIIIAKLLIGGGL